MGHDRLQVLVLACDANVVNMVDQQHTLLVVNVGTRLVRTTHEVVARDGTHRVLKELSPSCSRRPSAIDVRGKLDVDARVELGNADVRSDSGQDLFTNLVCELGWCSDPNVLLLLSMRECRHHVR